MNNLEQPPKTIEEVGIHLFYMAQNMRDLDTTVKESAKNYATKDELSEVDKRVKRLETKNIIKDTLLWVGLGTATNTADLRFTDGSHGASQSVTFAVWGFKNEDNLSLDAATKYYLNLLTEGISISAAIQGARAATKIYAENAYL